MIEKIKLWYYRRKTWIYNIQYIVYSILLLLLVMVVDLGSYPVRSYIPLVFFTSVDLAKTILSTLAGAQLTITTFTFSTILTVMSNYVSNFSPRVTDYFVEEKITMKVLGIFFGGFFYSLTALVFMRDALDDQLVIAGFVGVVYALVSMLYFIIFVQKVIVSSKSEHLISAIFEETLQVLKKELDRREEFQGVFSDKDGHAQKLYPNRSGYLSAIDYGRIGRLLEERPCELIIDRKIGDYVHEERPLAHVNQVQGQEFEEDLMEDLADSFHLTVNQVHENDYRNGMDKLEEIAIKALSPGINDPNTAIHCVEKISLLLSYLAKTDKHHIIVPATDQVKIAYTSYRFAEDLYYSFHQIVHYGREDVDVMMAIFEALESLYYSATKANQKDLVGFGQDLYENILPQPRGSYDQQRLEKIYRRLVREED